MLVANRAMVSTAHVIAPLPLSTPSALGYREMVPYSTVYACSSRHSLPSAKRVERNGVRSTVRARPSVIHSLRHLPIAGAVLKEVPLQPAMQYSP